MVINSSSLYSYLASELMISDRHQKREIRQLEQELPRWQVLVDNITGLETFPQSAKACVCLHLLMCVCVYVCWVTRDEHARL